VTAPLQRVLDALHVQGRMDDNQLLRLAGPDVIRRAIKDGLIYRDFFGVVSLTDAGAATINRPLREPAPAPMETQPDFRREASAKRWREQHERTDRRVLSILGEARTEREIAAWLALGPCAVRSSLERLKASGEISEVTVGETVRYLRVSGERAA
jgi:hypothetical protein